MPLPDAGSVSMVTLASSMPVLASVKLKLEAANAKVVSSVAVTVESAAVGGVLVVFLIIVRVKSATRFPNRSASAFPCPSPVSCS